jgi:Ala-tRNA(Pro) deacylase
VTDLYALLDRNTIAYERCDHPPVFTVEEADRLVPPLPAAKTKNLFLRDQKGKRHFLVCVEAAKQVNLKALAGALGVKRLSFGSARRLQTYLGVTPGAVSVFGIIHDTRHRVEVLFDRPLWQQGAFQFHPLVNTSTLCIRREALTRFADLTGHAIRILDLP